MMEKEAFFLNQSINAIYLDEQNEIIVPNHEMKGDLCESMFVLIDRQTLILKNFRNKSFLNKTKALMSYILIKRMSLWCPIMKNIRLLCEFGFVPIDR